MKIAVAMSGGVDSSVCAALLKKEGHDVFGFTLRLWRHGKEESFLSDVAEAKKAADTLGICHTVLDLSEPFKEIVVDYFLRSYATGSTPNPCLVCNYHIKFGLLMEKAKELGTELLATGHYARLEHPDNSQSRYKLLRAIHQEKDQSYVLARLSQSQLAQSVFPMGCLKKQNVREMASSLGLSNAQRQESQDICFLKGYDKDDFLADKIGIGKEPGDIVDKNGKLLGRHKGVLGYTIGQREGLGIAKGNPLYVIGIDVSANQLVVGEKGELLKSSCMVNELNWISIEKPNTSIEASVQIRARHVPAKAAIIPKSDDSVIVEFDEPQPAITPGQAAVLYRDDIVLGGGWIV